jgi:hypothetical protein
MKGSKIGYELFNRKISVKTTPLILKGCNFFAFNPFLPIFNVIGAPRGKFHLFFGDHKQWGPPAKMMNKPSLSGVPFGPKNINSSCGVPFGHTLNFDLLHNLVGTEVN